MNPISSAARAFEHHAHAHHVKGSKAGTSPLGAPTAAPSDDVPSFKPGAGRLGGPSAPASDPGTAPRHAGPLGGPVASPVDGPSARNPLATPLGGPAPVTGEPDATVAGGIGNPAIPGGSIDFTA